MKLILRLLTSTAFMMGLSVVVSLLTNQYVTGVYPDFLANDSTLRSNITIFLLVVISNSFSRWSSAEWGKYFCWTQVYIVGLVAIVSTVWFIWGGTRDLRRLFRGLAQRVDNPDDNGQVSDEFKKE